MTSRFPARFGAVLSALAVMAGACSRNDADRRTSIRPDASAPASAGAPAPRFTEIGPESGITLRNVSGDPDKMLIIENLGAGAALLDFDRDGDLDVFIANGSTLPGRPPVPSPNALYRNEGALRFTDVTAAAGLTDPGWCFGAVAADFDGDRWTDILVTGFDATRLWRNEGGRFRDVTEDRGPAVPGFATAAAFFDADGDGDLDLYVGRYVELDFAHPPNEGRPCDWKGLRVSCGPRGLPPAADLFFEQSEGRFRDATAAFGFAAVRPSYTLATVAFDHDGDGDVDLYVGNDSLENYLFENRGGRFADIAVESFCAVNREGREQATMGVTVGDPNGDGRPDIFATNFSHDTNVLYINDTKPDLPLFSDETAAWNLADASFLMLSWGTRFFDADLDGDLDIFVANGHVYPQVDGARDLGTTYGQRNQIFVRTGPTRYQEAPPETTADPVPAVSRGAALGDLDEDGDVDIVVVNVDAPPSVLRNDTVTPYRFIGFRLTGRRHPDAIGAVVTVVTPDGARRTFWRTSGESYASTCDPRIHAGIGLADRAAEVRVRWPGGREEVFRDLAAGTGWHLVEGSGRAEIDVRRR